VDKKTLLFPLPGHLDLRSSYLTSSCNALQRLHGPAGVALRLPHSLGCQCGVLPNEVKTIRSRMILNDPKQQTKDKIKKVKNVESDKRWETEIRTWRHHAMLSAGLHGLAGALLGLPRSLRCPVRGVTPGTRTAKPLPFLSRLLRKPLVNRTLSLTAPRNAFRRTAWLSVPCHGIPSSSHEASPQAQDPQSPCLFSPFYSQKQKTQKSTDKLSLEPDVTTQCFAGLHGPACPAMGLPRPLCRPVAGRHCRRNHCGAPAFSSILTC
jgi:hypothetical protein